MLLPLDQHIVLQSVERQWGDLCRKYADPLGIPDGYCQSHIYRESGGNDHAYRQERDASGAPIVSHGRPLTGVGLFQITDGGLKRGYTDAQLFDPELNIRIGTQYLAFLGGLYKWDFPSMCAAFNAGSVRPSSKNKWGMVQTAGHVSSEVAAYNYWLSMKLDAERKVAMMAAARQFNLFELLDGKDDDGTQKV